MEQILILLPGFFGIAVNKALSGSTKAEPLSTSIMGYVIYSVFSWWGVHVLSIYNHAINDPFKNNFNFNFQEYFFAILFASFLGFLWFWKIKLYLEKLVRKINRLLGKPVVGLSTDILEDGLRNCNKHYLQISKDGKLICSGVLISEDVSNEIIKLSLDPVRSFDISDNVVDQKNIEAIVGYVNIKTGVVVKDIIFMKKD